MAVRPETIGIGQQQGRELEKKPGPEGPRRHGCSTLKWLANNPTTREFRDKACYLSLWNTRLISGANSPIQLIPIPIGTCVIAA